MPNQPSRDALWGSLTSEPFTGVTILSVEGEVRFINPQSIRIYLDDEWRPEDVIGKSIHELLPFEFAEERLAIYRRIAADRKPRLVRTIWHGLQHHAWHYPLEGEDDDQPVTDILAVTRRTAEHPDQPKPPDGYEFIRAEVNDLGPLGDLSERELVVLALIGQGLTLKEVAAKVHRSLKTVQTQRDAIGRKLGVRSRSELQEIIVRAGLTLRDVDHENEKV